MDRMIPSSNILEVGPWNKRERYITMSSLLLDFFHLFVFTSKDSGAPASNKETSIVELLITKILKFAIGKKY
jgi:hypothetical protein